MEKEKQFKKKVKTTSNRKYKIIQTEKQDFKEISFSEIEIYRSGMSSSIC